MHMHKIMLVGDFVTDNGPGVANKAILHALYKKDEVRWTKNRSKIGRIIEVVFLCLWANVCMCCSASKLNYFLVFFAKATRTKIIYLMHGYSSFEYIVNGGDMKGEQYADLISYEKFIFENADRIVCVSKKFMNDMKERLPQYTEKFDYIYNVVNMDIQEERISNCFFKREKETQYILSLGGGMRQKQNLIVAKTIHSLNMRYSKKIKFIVVGLFKEDGEEIKRYECVEYYEQLPHDKVLQLMNACDLFIQNSQYETFGLAIIEALLCGSNILISKEVGCIDVFHGLRETDIINDFSNISEIEEKILYNLENHNNQRIVKGIKKEMITEDALENRIYEIITEIEK